MSSTAEDKADPRAAGHLPDCRMADYVAGVGGGSESAWTEEHCISCPECLAWLAILLRVCRLEASAEEQHRLAPLLAAGQQAARRARSRIMASSGGRQDP